VTSEALSNLLHEKRRFPPSDDFVAHANAGRSLYDEAGGDVGAFWERQARDLVSWDSVWTRGLDWSNSLLPSGSSAVRSTSATTASTGMSRLAMGNRWPSIMFVIAFVALAPLGR
jgi:hypothetical protein